MLRSVVIFSLASLVLPGCALPGTESGAQRLVEGARSAVERQEFDAAYRQLTRIRTEHPDSAHRAEAFGLAAAIFKRQYFRDRHAAPESPWVTREARFMLEWLAEFLGGPRFPQEEAEALLVGMNYDYFRKFLAYAKSRPGPSCWAVSASDENGFVESISAAPLEGPDC